MVTVEVNHRREEAIACRARLKRSQAMGQREQKLRGRHELGLRNTHIRPRCLGFCELGDGGAVLERWLHQSWVSLQCAGVDSGRQAGGSLQLARHVVMRGDLGLVSRNGEKIWNHLRGKTDRLTEGLKMKAEEGGQLWVTWISQTSWNIWVNGIIPDLKEETEGRRS